ncbi:hypothetical protein Curi_c03500 [Gottschalkia acidurici 9a]|uniref:Uncharacterized protein n=1 Tax=Gottschalkia acidurici (strain ATCC 7906 / DSM 604 / BCRC 14475 / CIP 104303 / KCTC 5404 / NCIMB 10678 / 9a) TaxID=1128398 RepID=K0AXH6_GOTA9|nr:hypothetical protein [Gottschalkia acidurici]AFS77425.1 hypothetical protein Curi_c03500 [Gottschalkia acidurici 9a]
MDIKLNENSTLFTNQMYKSGKYVESANKLGEKVQANINMKKDMLEISDEGMLKLKLRNLTQADKLEKRKDEYKEVLEQRLKIFEDAQSTIQLARKLILESMKDNVSTEEKENIDSEVKDMLEDIQHIVDEAVKNNQKTNVNNTEDIKDKDNNMSEYNDIELPSLEKEEVNEKEESKDKIDFKDIDIKNNPFEALALLSDASDSLLNEINKILKQINMLQKNIDELLGEDVEKKEKIKVEDINNNELVENIKEENNKENTSQPN